MLTVATRIKPDMTESFTKTSSLGDAARQIGVAPITLKRWLLTGKVGEVGRDRNGWRVFTASDIERIRAYANRFTLPEEK